MTPKFSRTGAGFAVRCFVVALPLFAVPSPFQGQVYAQGRDEVLNGVVIGAAIGAGAGVAFTHAVRDSDLTFGQYAHGALIFGAIGGGVGLGVDALLQHTSRHPVAPPRRFVVAPTIWRTVAGATLSWRW